MGIRRAGEAVAVMAGLLFVAGPLVAQAPNEMSVAAARRLGQEGVTLYKKGDYAQAFDKLDRAYAVVKVPTLGLWSARSLEKLGKLVEASERYREVTLAELERSAPQALRTAQADAKREYDALGARLPQLTVELSGAVASETTVSVGGKPLSATLVGAAVPVNPGTHKLEARRGQEVVTEEVTLREGEHRTVAMAFRPGSAAPAALLSQQAMSAPEGPAPGGVPSSGVPPSGGPPVAGYIVGGLGVVAMAVGAVTGMLVIGKKSTFDQHCDAARVCDQQGLDAASAGTTLSTVSTVSFVVGIVGVGVGTYLVLSHDSDGLEARASLGASPGSAAIGLDGRF